MENKEFVEGIRRLGMPMKEAVKSLRALAILCDKAMKRTYKENFLLKRGLKGKPKWLPHFLWQVQFYDVDFIRRYKWKPSQKK